MKKIILSRIFRFLFEWFRSRLAPKKRGGKPEYKFARRGKKLSPKHEHLLRMAQLLRTRFRQIAGNKI